MALEKPYVVGLTGGIASGKTTATEYLKTLGAAIIDADQISRDLTADGGDALPMIRNQFGENVMDNGRLNRSALAEIIFNDITQKRALESILHPMIQHLIIHEIDAYMRKNMQPAFISAPLLFESGMDAMCDEVWLLVLEPEEQITRAMKRDGLARNEIIARIENQMPLHEKMERADVKIQTNRPVAQTQQEIAALYRELKKRVNRNDGARSNL